MIHPWQSYIQNNAYHCCNSNLELRLTEALSAEAVVQTQQAYALSPLPAEDNHFVFALLNAFSASISASL